MKKILKTAFSFLLLSSCTLAFSQYYEYEEYYDDDGDEYEYEYDDDDYDDEEDDEVQVKYTKSQLEKADTTKNARYLSEDEKYVIIFCNLARLDGKLFVESFLSKMENSKNSYEKSLVKTLKKTKNLPMLVPDKKLCSAAKFHVSDTGPKGLCIHESSDGTSFYDRLKKYYPSDRYVGENISYGYDDAFKIVKQLLVDDGIESLGHRKNILDKDFAKIGVSIGRHSEYEYMCVQDFASK